MELPTNFDNSRRFIVSNWTPEEFTGKWDGTEYTIPAGTTKEFPMYLAFHLTKHLVDREMNRDKKSSLAGIDEERKPYEDKTLAEITLDTDSPALAALKEQIRAEVAEQEAGTEDKAPKVTKPKPSKKTAEFADIA